MKLEPKMTAPAIMSVRGETPTKDFTTAYRT